jgi:hypothetical protein
MIYGDDGPRFRDSRRAATGSSGIDVDGTWRRLRGRGSRAGTIGAFGAIAEPLLINLPSSGR